MKCKITYIKLILTGLFLSLIACHSFASSEKQNELQFENDTIIIGDWIFEVSYITKEDFEKIPSVFVDTILSPFNYKNEKKNIGKDSNRVSRKGDSLIFIFPNIKPLILKNENGAVYYYYLKDIFEVGQYIVIYDIDEIEHGFYLIDKQTGDTKIICSFPTFSPNKKYFICGSVKNPMGSDFNHIQLFRIIDKEVHLVTERYRYDWGVEDIKWINNNTLLAKKIILDEGYTTEYIKLTKKN